MAELVECLELISSMDINEKWVNTAERIVEILPKTLSHILNIPGQNATPQIIEFKSLNTSLLKI